VACAVSVRVRIRLRRGLSDVFLPARASDGASGFDLRAAISEPVLICRQAWAVVPTGVLIALPTGFEAQVRSRSGLTARDGVFVLNGVGTVDSDFRGEIAVILANLGQADFLVRHGDRIAQLVIAMVPAVEIVRARRLSPSKRGAGGFGSTGHS
jgi:dUTP pyrophosphatase